MNYTFAYEMTADGDVDEDGDGLLGDWIPGAGDAATPMDGFYSSTSYLLWTFTR
jgi:hypothetical protein